MGETEPKIQPSTEDDPQPTKDEKVTETPPTASAPTATVEAQMEEEEKTSEPTKEEPFAEDPVLERTTEVPLLESDQQESASLKKSGDVEDDVTMTFPQRLMEILNNEEHAQTISWLPHGRGFMIYKKKQFETDIMSHYFHKHSKYTSFTRKLNRWGFVRVTRGPEMGAYYHRFFKRGESRLCMQMSCQRPHGMSDVFPNNDVPPAMFQMPMPQNAGYPMGGQNYLQMQQQHMQLLMRHREQMIQREALLRSQGQGSAGNPHNMMTVNVNNVNGAAQMQGMKQSAPGGGPVPTAIAVPGQQMVMMPSGMMGMQQMQQHHVGSGGNYQM